MIIRYENLPDIAAIAEVNRLAFGQENEGRIVDEIRRGPGFDPRLSLVAEEEGRIVGHILFSPIEILQAAGAGEDARATWGRRPACPVRALALAPMAVRPELQRRGIGSTLVRAGLDSARSLGHRLVIVLGHPRYYPRFGFRPARPLGIEAPFPCRDEVFMALELVPGALVGARGTVRYPPAFDGV